MAQPAKEQFDESMINFYEEQLLAHADTVYRFAFALTLSLDGASRCVRHAYQNIANGLAKVRRAGEGNPKQLLLSECWKAYHDLKNQRFTEGQSAVTRALKPLALEPRAALVAVDVAGLAPADAAAALGWSELDLRVHLASARRALLASTLDI